MYMYKYVLSICINKFRFAVLFALFKIPVNPIISDVACSDIIEFCKSLKFYVIHT